jgi:hypothetical protein
MHIIAIQEKERYDIFLLNFEQAFFFNEYNLPVSDPELVVKMSGSLNRIRPNPQRCFTGRDKNKGGSHNSPVQ